MVTNDLINNGITNVVMNYCNNINKNQCDMTIIAGTPIFPFYKEQCDKNGIKVVTLPERKVNTKAYYKALWKELSAKKYDIVHIHGNSATITIELLIAKLKGIKVRIAHSHNCTCNNMKAHRILHPLFNKLYTHGFACSSLAGKWLFEKENFTIIPNGFKIERFIFDGKKRDEIREQFGIADKFVIGTVARFNDQKNHPYLLKVFEKVADEKDNAVLLLAGAGPNLEKTKELIENHKYKDRIIYAGDVPNPEYIYDASDVFVLTTKYEGLGIVFIEAQINGLPVVTSDRVPAEVNIGGRTKFVPLTDDVTEWKNAILNSEIIADRKGFYNDNLAEIQVYDISRNAKQIVKYYREMV